MRAFPYLSVRYAVPRLAIGYVPHDFISPKPKSYGNHERKKDRPGRSNENPLYNRRIYPVVPWSCAVPRSPDVQHRSRSGRVMFRGRLYAVYVRINTYCINPNQKQMKNLALFLAIAVLMACTKTATVTPATVTTPTPTPFVLHGGIWHDSASMILYIKFDSSGTYLSYGFFPGNGTYSYATAQPYNIITFKYKDGSVNKTDNMPVVIVNDTTLKMINYPFPNKNKCMYRKPW